MIYLWLNIGVLPFWLLLIFFPQTKICQIFTTSIFPLFIFSLVYGYLIFEIYKSGYNFLDNFNLYLGFDELINLFSEKDFLILFWIHFLSINLFCGSWMVKDSQKIGVSKFLTFFPSGRWDIIFDNNRIIKLPRKNVLPLINKVELLLKDQNFDKKVIDLRIKNKIILSNE